MENIEKSVEGKIILFTSLILGALTLISAFVNYILHLGTEITLIVFIISLVYFSIAFFMKRNGLSNPIKYFISLFSLIIINLVWFYNFRSRGPALGNFILFYAFILFIWGRRKAFIFASIILINIALLMLYDYRGYGQFSDYPSNEARILDVYIGIFIVLIVIHFYTISLKQNYLKQYERAKKSDELKTAFLANLSHEIRTPLNSIIGFSDLITTQELSDSEKEKYNAIIQSNSNDLLALIEDIVDLSLIESNEIKLVRTEFNLDEILKSLEIEYANIAPDKPIEITYKATAKPIFLNTDVLRVKQIVKNLINNAIKYTNQGTITFGYHSQFDEVEIFVADTGIGIKNEFKELIFNRFLKIENTSEIYRGVGIGLHLSKKIANLLGGDIWVESEFGKGSTFFLRLPLDIKKL